MKKHISCTVNNETIELEIEPHITLLELLRNHLGLTGAKRGCEMGDCGSCTVILDKKAVNACLILAQRVNGRRVVTIEGLSENGGLHPLQRSFIEKGAVQCGFCTPGMIMAAKALLDENPNPGEEDVKKAIGSNLCRCTGYQKIIEAIMSLASKNRKGN